MGLVRYTVNHKVKVTFDPDDPSFVNRLSEAFSKIYILDEEYSKKALAMADCERIYEFASKQDQRIRDTLNGLFGVEVCNPLFGNLPCVAKTTTGLPLWCNFLLATFDKVADELREQAKRENPHLAAMCLKGEDYKHGRWQRDTQCQSEHRQSVQESGKPKRQNRKDRGGNRKHHKKARRRR